MYDEIRFSVEHSCPMNSDPALNIHAHKFISCIDHSCHMKSNLAFNIHDRQSQIMLEHSWPTNSEYIHVPQNKIIHWTIMTQVFRSCLSIHISRIQILHWIFMTCKFISCIKYCCLTILDPELKTHVPRFKILHSIFTTYKIRVHLYPMNSDPLHWTFRSSIEYSCPTNSDHAFCIHDPQMQIIMT